MYIKIKDPSLFVSEETGEPLDIGGKVLMKQTLPRQVPKSINVTQANEEAAEQTDAMAGMIYVQIVI